LTASITVTHFQFSDYLCSLCFNNYFCSSN